VVSISSRAAALLVAVGDRAGADRALRDGLRLVPSAQLLWRDLLRLQAGSPAVVAEVVAQLRQVLPGRSLEGETEALVATVAPALTQTPS